MKSHLCIVEDDPIFSQVLKRFYEDVPKLFRDDVDLVVLQTRSMMEHLLSINSVVLIVLDLALPDSTQAQTVEWISSVSKTAPPIIAISGDERIEIRDKCLLAGAKAFALKKHMIESPNYFFANCYNEHVLSAKNG